MGNLKATFKEVLLSTLPIALIVFILQIALLRPSPASIFLFAACVVMVLIGFTIFLYGVDWGINILGEWMGSEISRRKSRLFMIAIVSLISFLVTVAEPDVGVFASQVTTLFTSLSRNALVYSIAIGVAIFLIIAACRIVFKLSLRLIITIGYVIVILLALFTPTEFLGIAFDSGGVTTGPMTVPILLSLGIGICSTGAFRNELDGYGMIGLASIGPIIALLVLGLLSGDTTATDAVEPELYEGDTLERLSHEFKDSLISVAMAIIPLMIFFAIFQKVFLRYSWNTVVHMVKGTTLAGLGIVIFLTAIYTGFIPVAADIGAKLYEHPIILMLLGAVLGFLVAIAEPAVEILAGRVQKSSGGNITKKVVKYVISGGVAMFVAIGMLRLSYDFSLLWIVVPGYILAIILMWIGDKDMVGIAFDAGGVSTGPMSVAIISSMYTSIASVMYDGTDAIINGFGIIALIALAPILFLEAFSVYIKIMKVKDGRQAY
ncbi:MAG: DUF1538 domain-containing protein [Candidatus Methanomethylophilaceae archaeon]|nr:DUF1538 domain-containing protein [Candidatus Methanomethylophilaceae archaeon]